MPPKGYDFNEVHGNNATPIHEKVATAHAAPTAYEQARQQELAPINGPTPPPLTESPTTDTRGVKAYEQARQAELAPIHPSTP